MATAFIAALGALRAHQGWLDVIGNNLANAGGVTTTVAGVGSPSHGSRNALNPVVNRLPVIPPPFADAGGPSMLATEPSMIGDMQPQQEP